MFCMDRNKAFFLIQQRLEFFILKLYGQKLPLKDSTIESCQNFLLSGKSIDRQLFKLLCRLDQTEYELLVEEKKDLSLQDEDELVIEQLRLL